MSGDLSGSQVVRVRFFDADGALLDSMIDNVNDVDPGRFWRFPLQLLIRERECERPIATTSRRQDVLRGRRDEPQYEVSDHHRLLAKETVDERRSLPVCQSSSNPSV